MAQKSITRTAAYSLAGVFAFATLLTVSQGQPENANAISGTWADYTNTSWYNPSDSRYNSYTEAPGSSEASPFLIKTAEEFSGIRNFEGGSDLAGKYLKLANAIDFSAHYWDPIKVYGAGDSEYDILNIDYSGNYWIPGDDEVVYFDGDMQKITGLTIQNDYDKAVVFAGDSNYRQKVNTGATGLFSFTYKTRLANINLVSPSITLSESSYTIMQDYTSFNVSDTAGTVVGAAHNSRIVNVHVSNPQVNYNPSFGEAKNEWDQVFAPTRVVMGGIVGYSFGQTFVIGDSIKGGSISANPTVPVEASVEVDSGIHIGGAVGLNIQSVIMSTCSGSNVSFSDAGYTFGQYVNGYDITIGGVTGMSNSENSFQACTYNTCANGDVTTDITSADDNYVFVGGIVGLLENDSLINTFYDGNITTNATYAGEIAGSLNNQPASAYIIASNYHLDRGIGAYGTANSTPLDANGQTSFTEITTSEQLLADLNAGRQLVIDDIITHAAGALTDEFITAAVNFWEKQDGKRPLDCIGTLGVGLVFPGNVLPEEPPIGVPNTGAK